MASKLKLMNSNGKSIEINSGSIEGDKVLEPTDFKYIRNTVAEMLDLNGKLVDGDVVFLKGYHSVNDGGGGTFVYSATGDKSTHNGGTVIDPLKAFPSDWDNEDLKADWFNGNNSGTGVLERVYSGAVNVKWFGAKGDGVTDDTQACDKTVKTANIVYFPKGEFLLGKQLTSDDTISEAMMIDNDDVMIYGDGNNSKLIAPYPNGSSGLLKARNIFRITGNNVKIFNLFLDGNQHTDSNGNVVAGGKRSSEITIANNSGVVIENCYFYNSASQPINVFDNSSNIVINNCVFDTFFEAVVYVSVANDNTKNITVSNCLIESKTGIIPDDLVINQKGNIIGIEPKNTNTIENVYIKNNICKTSGTGIMIGAPCNIRGLYVENNVITQYKNETNGQGIIGAASGLRLTGISYNPNDTDKIEQSKIFINGNIIENFSQSAILIASSDYDIHDVKINNNMLKNCRSTSGYSDGVIEVDTICGAIITGNAFLKGQSSDSNDARYVAAYNNPNNLFIKDNYIDTNTTLAIDFSTLGARSYIKDKHNTLNAINTTSDFTLNVTGDVIVSNKGASSNITINIDYPDYYEKLIIYIATSGNDVKIQLPSYASVEGRGTQGGYILSDGTNNNEGDIITLVKQGFNVFTVQSMIGSWSFN